MTIYIYYQSSLHPANNLFLAVSGVEGEPSLI